MPRWRKYLTIVALVCVVGLYSDAVTHHHQTLAQEMGCPVCHVVSHNALSTFTPSLAPPVLVSSWVHASLPRGDIGGFRLFLNPAHRSRAPPSLAPKLV